MTAKLKSGGRYVLTGGPGVGKTTVINELAKRGYQTTPEAYTLLDQRAAKNHTLDTFLANSAQSRSDLMHEQVKLESSLAADKPAFLDRSTVDVVAFGDYFHVPMSQALRDQANKNYDLVFFLNPLPEQLYKNTAIRKETVQEAAKIHNFLKAAYKKLGYKKSQIIDVPFGTPEERTQFILNKSLVEKLPCT